MGYKRTYESLDDALSEEYGGFSFSDTVGLLDLTKNLENTIWRAISSDEDSAKIQFNFVEDEADCVTHFNRGEEIDLHSFLCRLACPCSARLLNPPNDLSEYDRNEFLEKIACLKEWKVKTELDTLRSCIESREGSCYIVYRWYDGQIHIARDNVYKNLDWYEYINELLPLQSNLGDLPDGGIDDYFAVFLDAEYDEPVFDFYKYITCGFRINIRDKYVTVYDKETTAYKFHTLCDKSLEQTWTPAFVDMDCIPQELRDKYDINNNDIYGNTLRHKLLHDLREAFVYPNGKMIFPDIDYSTEEGRLKAKSLLDEYESENK